MCFAVRLRCKCEILRTYKTFSVLMYSYTRVVNGVKWELDGSFFCWENGLTLLRLGYYDREWDSLESLSFAHALRLNNLVN